MRQPNYLVDLSEEERVQFETLLHKGKSRARKQTWARILLKASADMPSQNIEKTLEVSGDRVYRVRQRFVECGGPQRSYVPHGGQWS